jgi:hypothetical protein
VPPIREQYIQRAVFDHIRWRRMPGVFAFRVPNAGKHNSVEAAILEALKARAGVPDVFAIGDGRCYALELKTKTGRLTSIQKHAMAVLERAGALTTVCRRPDPALHPLKRWSLLRAGRWWAEGLTVERPLNGRPASNGFTPDIGPSRR